MVRRSGFGLVEVIVAMTLLGIGVLSVAGSAAYATRMLRIAEAREQATRIAEILLDSLAFSGSAASGERNVEQFHIQSSAADGSILVHVASIPDTTIVSLRFEAAQLPALPALPDTAQ